MKDMLARTPQGGTDDSTRVPRRDSRCVKCGAKRSDHAENLTCVGSAGGAGMKYGSMDLPDGKTCADCKHIKFCTKFLGEDVAGNDQCDWFPIRFVQKEAS